ncbi:MAG: glycosyltransferase [Armatimonadetes bacterium]|nr:glycosyltransferase [Armatimonadota bacterium]
MSKPFVSVIIPVYNSERYIACTLESLQNQTFEDFEAIVVDDASTDSSVEIAKQFMSDRRFQLIARKTNGGAAAAQNTGVATSSGEWIALLGSDDVWMPDKLARQVGLIDEHPDAALVFSNGIEFDESGDLGMFYHERRKFPEGYVLERLLDHNCFWASSVMVRQKDLIRIGLFSEDLAIGEDYLAWALILARQEPYPPGGKAVGVWDPLVRYRKSASSLSNRRDQAYHDIELVHRKLLNADLIPRHKAILRKSLARDQSDQKLCAARLVLDYNRMLAAANLFRAWMRLPYRVRLLFWIPMLILPVFNESVKRSLARKW